MSVRKAVLLFGIITMLGCSAVGNDVVLPEHPNIIFILTDDMTVSDLDYMPKTKKLIKNKGVSFDQFFVNVSFCCPSRVSILRGQYAHNTKIYDNEIPNGGFEKVYELGLEESMLPVWVQNEGYRTALFGKYMSSYPNTAEITYIPPGWSEWYSRVFGYPYDGYNYTFNENGTLVEYGSSVEDYVTDVLADKSVDFIDRSINDGQPFFAYIATYAPHKPSTPAPRHAGMFSSVDLPRPPSFDEPDMSDKNDTLLWKFPLTEEDIAYLETHYRLRLESLQAVDEMVEKIYLTLEAQNQLDNTYIFFTSDNGIEMGQHRLVEKKNSPYEDDIKVPFLVFGPGIRSRLKVDEISGNIDIAPTIADLVGATSPDFIDGRSLVPLMLGDTPSEWRNAYLIQRAIPVSHPTEVTEWVGLRTDRYVYLEFRNGIVHIYDLKKDPYQLGNFASDADPEFLKGFHDLLDKLKQCAGDSCREIDQTSP